MKSFLSINKYCILVIEISRLLYFYKEKRANIYELILKIELKLTLKINS